MNKGTAVFINLILILTVALIFGIAGYYFLSAKAFVPEIFSEARNKSSLIAAELVSILDKSLKSLDKISEEDRNYRFTSALNLVKQEIQNIEMARAKALELSSELEKMAQALQDIRPVKARNLVLEAVTQEVSLIVHITYYNTYLDGLLQVLKMKFMEDFDYDSNDVQIFISNMNKEAEEINSINESFNQKLKEFDAIVE